MRNDDTRELQRKVLELARGAGSATHYRMLEIHARLQKLVEEQEATPEPVADTAKGQRAAA
jgi:hypothetical protein